MQNKMMEKQEWKQNVAKDFIEHNINFDSLLWLNNIDKIMNILFNKNGKQRTNTGFELNKMKNLSYYLITSDGQRKLDLLFNEMQKAKSEDELKIALSNELEKLQESIETWQEESNDGRDNNDEEFSENVQNQTASQTEIQSQEINNQKDENMDLESTSQAVLSAKEENIETDIQNVEVMEVAHLWSNWKKRKRWEKLEVEKKQREHFLFENGVPKTKEEMESKYLTAITVPILNKKWWETSLKLKVHKKLKKFFECVFKELKDSNIKIDPESTWSYVWRKMRRGKSMSEHSYWSAIDINWNVNWWVYGKTDENSELFNSQKTVEIFKKYWFAWWWDWSKKSNDPMHFSYMWS